MTMTQSHSKSNSARVTECAPGVSSVNRPKRLSPIAPPQLRQWTVGYRHRYVEHRYTYPHAGRRRPEPPPVPFLPLQGHWLHQAGFAIGTSVRVLVTSRRLVLEVDERADAKPESRKTSKSSRGDLPRLSRSQGRILVQRL